MESAHEVTPRSELEALVASGGKTKSRLVDWSHLVGGGKALALSADHLVHLLAAYPKEEGFALKHDGKKCITVHSAKGDLLMTLEKDFAKDKQAENLPTVPIDPKKVQEQVAAMQAAAEPPKS
jgi:hypothetical protein